VSGWAGVAYTPNITANNNVLDSLNYTSGDTLILPVLANASDGATATVQVTISSKNYADVTSTVTVRAVNKIVTGLEGVGAVSTYTFDGAPHTGYTGVPAFPTGGPTAPTLTARYPGAPNNGATPIPADTAPTAAGIYTVSLELTGNAGGNDYLAEWTNTFRIDKADPSVSAPTVNAVYGQTLGDIAGALPAGFAWKEPATTPVGDATVRTFTAVYTPADIYNYNTAEKDAQVTVAPKPLHIENITTVDRDYDGAATVTLMGGNLVSADLIPGDEAAVGFTLTGATSNKAAGAGKAVAVTATLTGARAANYAAAASTGLTVNITPKPIGAADITVAAPSKVSDGTTAATLTAGVNADAIIAGDNVTISLTGNYADASEGYNKAVTVTAWRLGGADAANYALEGPLPTGILGAITAPSGGGLGGGGGGGGGGGPLASDEEEDTEEDKTKDEDKAKDERPAEASAGTAQSLRFADVDAVAWYYGDVEFAVSRGLFVGTGASAFSPNEPMTRGMLVTVLGRLCGVDASAYASAGFDDVDANMYYAPYIAWAAENGIVLGTGDGFAPDADITRQDLALILMRIADFRGDALSAKRDFTLFTDDAEFDDYAKNAAKVLFEAGILNGRPGDLFDPKGKATRAEVAAVLRRYIESVE
jgi:hypothetical protein